MKHRMRIVNVNKFYYLRGGAERAAFALADLLEEYGHEVIPFAMEHPENLETPYKKYFPSYVEFGQRGVTRSGRTPSPSSFLNVISRMFWSFETARKFDQLLRDTKPDLIHIHNIYHQLSPSLLPVARRYGIPVVMTAHDYKLVWPDYLLCGYTPGASRWNVVRERCTQVSFAKSLLATLEFSFHKFLRVYERHLERIFVPSEFVRKTFLALGQDPEKVVVLPHFVESIRESKISKAEKPTLLYVGRLSKEKGVDILLDLMQNTGFSAELKIAGEGPEEKELRMRNAELGMNNVTFLGHLNQEALQNEMRRAWCTVIPSRVPETFGLVALESFAVGTPVVAARIGALPEIVRDGTTGLLFTPDSVDDLSEKIQTVLRDETLRSHLGRAAQTLAAKEYSRAAHAQKLFHHYDLVRKL